VGFSHEPLLTWKDGELAPSLIDSWNTIDDGRTWQLTLREAAEFHDGTPCTAEDVVWALEQIKNSRDLFGMKTPYGQYLEQVQFEAAADDVVKMCCPEATADLLELLPDIYVHKQGEPTTGTGPYRIADHAEGRSITLSPVKEDSAPELEFRQVPNEEERLELLSSQEAAVATRMEHSRDELAARDFGRYVVQSQLSVTGFLNGFEAPFDSPLARLAVNLAVDRQALINDLWDGLAYPANTVVSPQHLGYPRDLPRFRYDPVAARVLFDAVGFSSELTLRTPTRIPDGAPELAQFIREQLEDIGLKVRIEVEQDRPKYARDVSEKKIGHMALFDSSPLSTFRVLTEKVISDNPGLWWQGVEDASADALILAARSYIDFQVRRAAYAQCLTWLRNNPHWLYLYHPVQLYGHQREVPEKLLKQLAVKV
jgi:peptide/nickel transport system substrate-binding protein